MKLYSNKILSWFEILHTFNAGRLYPGKWNNYYFYQIKTLKPFSLTTYSPLELLQENNKYYCYEKYMRNKGLEEPDNLIVPIYSKDLKVHIYVYIPKTVKSNDLIVIKSNLITNYTIPIPVIY